MDSEKKIIEFNVGSSRFLFYKKDNNIVLDYSCAFHGDTWDFDEYEFPIKIEHFKNGIDELMKKGNCNIPMIDDSERKYYYLDSGNIFFEKKDDSIYFGFRKPYIDMKTKIDELEKLVRDHNIYKNKDM